MPKITVVAAFAPCASRNARGEPCWMSALKNYPFVGHAPRCWWHEAKYLIDRKRRPAASPSETMHEQVHAAG